MVHKIEMGVKYDDDGDVIMEGLNPKQKKFFELKQFYKYTPSKLFERAFEACWSDGGMDFDSSELDAKIEEFEEAERDRELFAKARMGE